MTPDDLELRVLSVGESLNPNRELWPEGPHYDIPCGEHELSLFYGSPKPLEIASVNAGIFHFGFIVIDPLIFFCFRAGALSWADAPFSWHRMNPDHRVLPRTDLEHNERAAIRIILADTDRRGRIEALRFMSLSPQFTLRLHQAIVRQASQPAPTPEQYQATVAATYQRYTSAQVAAQCRWRCRGGE